MQIAGSSVLLTGATGGIGHAIARVLDRRGASLLLTGRRTEVLEPLAEELGARALVVDLSVDVEVEQLAAEAADTDILVANAGLPGTGRLESYRAPEIDRALAVNLRAPIMLAHALAPAMARRGQGHLLFMSSLSGKVASPGSSIYCATKFGLRGFCSGLRADLHSSGVGVSCVFPGFIRDAGMFADAGVKLPIWVRTRSPEDVAEAVVEAIEHNKGEIDVAPLSLRVGTTFAGIVPELAATLTRRGGGEQIADSFATAQSAKR
jgi:uncharacterized protein